MSKRQEFIASKCQNLIAGIEQRRGKELAVLARLEKEIPQKLPAMEREIREDQKFLEQALEEVYLSNPEFRRFYRERDALTGNEINAGLGEYLDELFWGQPSKDYLKAAVDALNAKHTRFKFNVEGDHVSAYQPGKTYDTQYGKVDPHTQGWVNIVYANGRRYLLISTNTSYTLPREVGNSHGIKIVDLESGLEALELKQIHNYADGTARKKLLSEPFSSYLSRIPELRKEAEQVSARETGCRDLLKRLNAQATPAPAEAASAPEGAAPAR